MAAFEHHVLSGANSFGDTNVFVYAQDTSDPRRRTVALELLKSLSAEGRILISTQVLQEFASVAVRKLGLSLPETHALLDELAKLPVCATDVSTIKEAVTIHFAHKLSYFDSLIIASAAQNRCSFLYSEDMASGQTIRGVTIVNPFA
jgi:predicted nucleic acid-binding protein